MALVRIAEVQQGRLVGGEYSTSGSLIKLLCLWGGRRQGAEGRFRASRNEFCIPEALVIAIVSEKLGGVVEKVVQVLIRNSGLGLKGLPVTTT